jgi:hypothetical protein
MEKPTPPSDKNQPAKSGGTPEQPAAPQAIRVAPPPLFRKIDWIALLVTFVFVFVAYYLTIAPEMTLEDSGELAAGSFYAGIPHPPGYPVWTIFTHLWTVLLPVGNVAWRVAVADSFSGALAAGMLAFIVSRGSSMMIESIDDLKNFNRRWENTICLVSGFVAGILIGFNGYMWSQANIVEVYPLSVASLMGVLLCLLRWVYAPYQHRYLYGAFFLYGICFNNHQSLLVIAMGMETMVILSERKVGREMMFWNTLLYLVGLLVHPEILASNTPVFVIFNLVGIVSAITWFVLIFLTRQKRVPTMTTISLLAVGLVYLAGACTKMPGVFGPDAGTFVKVVFHIIGIISLGLWLWLVIEGKKGITDLLMDVAILAALGGPLILLLAITHYLPQLSSKTPLLWLLAIMAVAGLVYFIIFTVKKWATYREWFFTLGCGVSWLIGAAFYLYMPIAGATVPPMEWGYPRTLDGFIHAITRGQYEKIHPTSGVYDATAPFLKQVFEAVVSFFQIYGIQIWRYLEGLNDEFNILYLLLALVVFLFYLKMKRRERTWILGSVAIFICLGPFLVLLLNFPSDRQSLELNRVFLTSSHVIISMFVGFGLTLLAAYMATHYASSRRIFMVIGACIIDMAVFMLVIQSQDRFDLDKADWASALGYIKVACWLLAATGAIIFWRKRIVAYVICGIFAVLSLVPTLMALSSLQWPPRFDFVAWADARQGIADAFKPMHYGLPVYASLMLIGLGVVFLVALWRYRTHAPLAITLVVFALMPSYSIFNHWFDNEQRNHWFGYWFGHDMFTPPVTGPDGQTTYDAKIREQMMKGTNGGLVYPEMTRNAILFGGTDPGRFAPTYMIFCDSFIPHKCLPEFDQNFDRRDVYIITQNALADPTYLQYIRSQYFRSDEYQYDTPFFQEVLRGKPEHDKYSPYYGTNIIARVAYNLLDKPITDMGARVEKRRRAEGVFPPKEIYTPNQDDSQQAFMDYMDDAHRRLEHDSMYPNEPRQMKPGEDVRVDPGGHVQVSGQVAVMSINGLLTKVIFDKNPTNEFFVEESFPLDWMFPHLTPFGIIMKINRESLPVLTGDILKRDHEFWAKYSERLVGNWITYDTSVKEITDFAERVYMHHDYTGFKGDLKFVRDDDAQKAFSKLRSSIGGVYSWRVGQPPSGGVVPQQYVASGTNFTEVQREADFALKQAFAFCPYSPEAVFRYVQLLVPMRRFDDALLVAQTAQKLDPYNNQFQYLISEIEGIKKSAAQFSQPADQLEKDVSRLEGETKANPTNFVRQFELAQKLLQLGQTDRMIQVLDGVITNPQANADILTAVAAAYGQLGKMDKLENVLEKLTRIDSNSPEAWYDLAGSRAVLNQTAPAIAALKQALDLSSKRLASNPKAADLRVRAASDPEFNNVRNTPEFNALLAH